MIFQDRFWVAPNTSDSNPLRRRIKVSPGIIHKVEVRIPGGHQGLTGVRILHGEVLIFPSRSGAKTIGSVSPGTDTRGEAPVHPELWFSGDDEKIEFNDYYDITKDPLALTIEAFNKDEEKDHEFIVRIYILEEWQINPWKALEALTEAIWELSRKIEI